MRHLSRRIVAAVVALSLVASALPAVAQEKRTSVALKNGDVLRGEIVERVRGDHITLRLADGTEKIIPWEELAAPPASAPMPPSGGAAPTATSSLNADPRLHLDRRIGSSSHGALTVDHWEYVCSSPCPVALAEGEYRFSGPGGFRSIDPFRVPAGGHVEAKFGSAAGYVGGWFLAVLGGATVTGGGVILGAVVGNSEQKDPGVAIGLGVVAVGAGLIALGAWMISSNGNAVTVNGERIASARRRSGPGFALTPTGFVF